MLQYLPVMLTVIIWSWSEVLIKHLQGAGFDSYSQNFYRYSSAAFVVIVLALIRDREGLKKALSSPAFVIAGILCAAYQTLFVLGLYYVFPAFSALIKRSNMLLTVVIAVIFFADERRLAGNPRFLAALVFALLGVSGLIALHPDMAVPGNRWDLLFGSGLIILGSFFWVGYSYVVKLMTRKVRPVSSFAAASAVMAVVLFFVALGAQQGGHADLGRIFEVRWYDLLILFGSGILNVGIAQVIYYTSIRLIGVTVSQTFALATSLLVGVNSFLVFRETLTVPQWLSGLVLLLALAYVLRLEGRLRQAPTPEVAG